MKSIGLFIYTLFLFHSAFSQDTIRLQTRKPQALSAVSRLYFFVPSDHETIDSIIVINSNAYYSLIQDKQACATFTQLYQMYKKRIGEGDVKVQELIKGYEVIIQTKDSSYTTLLKQYDAERALTTKSIQQTTETLHICRSSLDSINTSLNSIEQENNLLKQDLKTIKKRHNTQKWSFALVGVSIGILVGLLLMH